MRVRKAGLARSPAAYTLCTGSGGRYGFFVYCAWYCGVYSVYTTNLARDANCVGTALRVHRTVAHTAQPSALTVRFAVFTTFCRHVCRIDNNNLARGAARRRTVDARQHHQLLQTHSK